MTTITFATDKLPFLFATLIFVFGGYDRITRPFTKFMRNEGFDFVDAVSDLFAGLIVMAIGAVLTGAVLLL